VVLVDCDGGGGGGLSNEGGESGEERGVENESIEVEDDGVLVLELLNDLFNEGICK